MSSNLERYTNESQNPTSISVTILIEQMFYLFSKSNVALKMVVSLPSYETFETGKSEGYLLGFSIFYKMELEIFLKDLSSKCYLLN